MYAPVSRRGSGSRPRRPDGPVSAVFELSRGDFPVRYRHIPNTGFRFRPADDRWRRCHGREAFSFSLL